MLRGGSIFTTADTVSYSYNTRNEVTSAQSADYDFDFSYDTIGNRTSATSNETGSTVTTSYTTNELNQYTSITNPNQSPTYDDDGNCTSAVLSSPSGGSSVPFSFTFNPENRLVSAESDTKRLEFIYDYMGRRVSKKIFNKLSDGSLKFVKQFIYIYDAYKQLMRINPSFAVLKMTLLKINDL